MDIDQDARIPLGVGSLIGDAFGLFFRNLPMFVAIAFVPTFLVGVINAWLINDLVAATVTAGPGADPLAMFTPLFFLSTFLGFLVIFLVTALLTLASYDRAAGRPIRIGTYFFTTLRFILPLILLSIVYFLMVYVGLILLVLPGLYLAARYWVMTPAMLVEPAGWRALRRASVLSKSYRWPMVGAMIVLILIVVVMSIALQILVTLITTGSFSLIQLAQPPLPPTGLMLYFVVAIQSLSGAVIYGLSAVFTALLYARLREIKEGLGMGDLREVFK